MELTIILLCHNRPQMAVLAIDSILCQTIKNFKLIISDNSTNKDLYNLIQEKYNEIEYISWFPGITASEHFMEVRKLIDSQYFVLFHDDDIMDTDYVREIINKFKEIPNVAAIGTNGIFIDYEGNQNFPKKIFKSKSDNLIFENSIEILNRYLTDDAGGAAPFSSYAYNTKLIQNVYMDWSMGRAFFDTIFLSEIARENPIIWINKPLVLVREHAIRISNTCGVRDYKAFINLVKNKYKKIPKYYIEEYRLVHLYFELKRRKKFPNVTIKYFILNIPKLFIISKKFRNRIFRYSKNLILYKY